MSDRFYLVVNPSAGGRTARLWPAIEDYLQQIGVDYEAGLTGHPGEATELARQAVRSGFETVVAVGGDGTINEVVNGLIQPGEQHTAIRLGIIATGRGSDLGRTIGIPGDIESACERLMDPRTMPMDLGLAEFTVADQRRHRFFINVAGIGFDAEVVARANRSFPTMRGTVPYLSALVLSLFSWRNRTVEIYLDDLPPLQTKVYLVAVANGQFFGGGMRVAPEADPNDGLLDAVIVHDIGKVEFLKTVPRVYEGTHVTHPAIDIYRVRRIAVHCSHPLPSELDGELGGQPPLIFQNVPHAIELLV